MAADNTSSVTEFILTALRDQPGLQLTLFFLFLGFYVITTLPSTIIPKMLMSFVSKKNIISYSGCITQLFFFCFFDISESFILSAMAYDRYVAICKPLLYSVTMSPQVCLFLLLGVYGMGTLGALDHTRNMLFLTFCGENLLNHYMCDILPLLELSCNSSYMNILAVFIFVAFCIGTSILTIFLSYSFILSSIFHISSTEGRSKAFSTCSSHIIAVSLFFGSGIFAYLKPPSIIPLDKGKVCTVFYTIVVPMFNPLIYSLRNKDVKLAVNKTLGRIIFS
ncbi:olfactory receptor 8B12-like [Sturnira hondurensis]|uniref:olfactory receptor 8B12-like n=1 Tax=Sturnira hondurensis TaxID=192404 RepID=UPI00187B0FBD|nr:olfactory receptor 8B12-like [Sturnira hondurensis]